MKLGFWRREDSWVADLSCRRIPDEDLYMVTVTDGFGLAEGYEVVFCEEPKPEPDGLLWILSVMRRDEILSVAAIEILRARRAVVRERSSADFHWAGRLT